MLDHIEILKNTNMLKETGKKDCKTQFKVKYLNKIINEVLISQLFEVGCELTEKGCQYLAVLSAEKNENHKVIEIVDLEYKE